jgi:hypothetical protein
MGDLYYECITGIIPTLVSSAQYLPLDPRPLPLLCDLAAPPGLPPPDDVDLGFRV